jgi:hypothetical protein
MGKNQHVVKREDGWAVRDKDSYGNDPNPPKG